MRCACVWDIYKALTVDREGREEKMIQIVCEYPCRHWESSDSNAMELARIAED